MRLLTAFRIHTLDPRQPFVEALLISGEKILAAGETETLHREFPRARHEHLEGLTLLPGLTDAHLHLQHYALSLQKVDCETDTLRECLQRVTQRARTTPPDAWILGHGWNQNTWPDTPSGGFPTAADLDAVTGQRPAYLTAKSLHAGWANSAALRAAGITASTPDPADGRIGRDAHGKPTGMLFESAMHLLAERIPQPAPESITQAICEAQPHLWQAGLTGVHDFDRRESFIALQTLHQRGDLRLRVLKNLPVDLLDEALALGLRSGFGDDTLRIGGLKAFADGALGPHTAAMFVPYQDAPANRGMLLLDAEEIYAFGHKAAAGGLALTIHAIGDRANHEVLEAYARLRAFEKQNGLPPLRHRIEHVQVLHPQDAARLGELGLIASMQPVHAVSDMHMADRLWGERARLSYAWRTQLEAGAVLAFGSDAPVESPNPFWGLHAALTRQRADGTPEGGWYPAERLTLREAWRAFTFGAAYAAGMEARLGRLTPGFLADLIALPADPFALSPDAIRDLRPQRVMCGGAWVWEA
ncbi:MAG: amidohydrolase [Anaerolineales bacterium]